MWLRAEEAPDQGGYSSIHSSPIYPKQPIAPHRTVPQCATCIISLPPSHQGASSLLGSLKSLIRDMMDRMRVSRVRLAGLLTACISIVTYSAGLHTMSHQITVCPGLRLVLVLVLVLVLILVRSCGQGTVHNVALYPMYLWYLSHRSD